MGNEPKKYIDLSLYSPLPISSPQKLSEISWFVCLDITSLFVTSTANDSNAHICLHSNIHKWTKPNEQSHNRRPKRPFRMDYAKMTIFILLAFSCLHNTDGRCTPQDCQVSSWTYWSSCYGERCGGRGVQRRTRWQDIVPSCGGSECPILEETRSCDSELTRWDCQLSSWSHWSTCSTPCGVSGVESSSRYKIITEQCGGYCPSILLKISPVSNWAASTEGVWITMEHAPVPRAILDNAVKWNLTVNDLRSRKLFLCLHCPILTWVNKTRLICIGYSWWGCSVSSDSPNADPISDQKTPFSHPFSDLHGQKLCHHYLD